METRFTVVNTGPTNLNYCFGKDEYWTCINGFLPRQCWKTTPSPSLSGPKTARLCDGGDLIAPDDPY